MWLVVVFICFGWILSLCLHEFGHAIVAYWGGDTSVKDKGYLTLNPLKYTEPSLSLMMPLFFLLIGGIALPGGAVYINHSRLRDRKWKSAVSAAGPIANLILAYLLSLPFQFGWDSLALENPNSVLFALITALTYIISLNIYVVLINLLPIPALDGYGIIEPWLPQPIQQQINKVAKYGIWILIGLLWFARPFNQFLWNFTNTISEYLNLPENLTVLASAIFREYSRYLVIGLVLVLWIFRDKNQELQKQGDKLVSSQQYDQAIACYDKLIKNKPKNADAWYWRGHALYSLNKHDEAITAYDKVIEIRPEDSNTWWLRGQALAAQQNYQAAVDSYNRAITIYSDFYGFWLDRGNALYFLQQYEDAIASYEKVIQLKPDNINAWNYKGVTLIKLQRYEEALVVYDQAIEIKSDCADYWYNKACCYALQNNVTLAIQNLQQSIKLESNRLQLVKTDPDFDAIRKHEMFKILVNEYS